MNINVARVFNVVALILLLAGAFTPYWTTYKITKGTTTLGGIFYSLPEGISTINKGLFYYVGTTPITSKYIFSVFHVMK